MILIVHLLPAKDGCIFSKLRDVYMSERAQLILGLCCRDLPASTLFARGGGQLDKRREGKKKKEEI